MTDGADAEDHEGDWDVGRVAALGAPVLAKLLVAFAERDAAIAQALRLRLAECGDDTGTLVATITAELDAMAVDTVRYGYDASFEFARTIERLRLSIVESLLPRDPSAAAALLGRFVRLDGAVFERVDDSGGTVGDVFVDVMRDYGEAWAAVSDRDPAVLAEEVFDLFANDDYGVRGGAIRAFADALGATGLDALERRIRDDRRGAAGRPQQALLELADARGDVDGFIALHVAAGAQEIAVPDICQRLVDAGRPAEALGWIDPKALAGRDGWRLERLRIDLLEQLGRLAEAREARSAALERSLSLGLFHALIEGLDDEARAEAVQRATTLAFGHADTEAALQLLVDIDPAAAAVLVLSTPAAWSGHAYSTLRPAAEILTEAHPLAAVFVYRRMVDAVLERGRSKEYRSAVPDLAEAEGAGRQVSDRYDLPDPTAYREGLRRRHGLKRNFWQAMRDAGRP